MIKNIYITNNKEETLTVNISNYKNSGFTIRKIDGLGPVKANINTTPIVTNDGDLFNSARAEKRNIVLTLGFEIMPEIGLNTIEDVRQKTYNFFPLKSLVKIQIETDNRELYTYGYVESNEPDIFSEDETCMVSLICPDSYFTSIEERNLKLDQLKSVFRFPFEVRFEDLPDLDYFDTSIVYEKTKDTEIDYKKEYYRQDGQAPHYTYILVPDPKDEDLVWYYEKIDNHVQVIVENDNLGDTNNGNFAFKLYKYRRMYFDLFPLKYRDLSETYEQLKYI